MTVIAVAGGSGGVGKTIVERLAQEPKYQVITFSRKPTSNPSLPKVQSVQVNYADVASMTKTLEAFNVHTVISTIVLVSEEASQGQLNLIDAAEAAKNTKRFVPSEFLFIQPADRPRLDAVVDLLQASATRLRQSSLQYTRIAQGLFMDYWGMPHAPSTLIPITFGINIAKREAVIPGDGNDPICMTYSHDMTDYLVKILDTDDWPEFSVLVGDQVSYNQILKMAEEIIGTKFKVTYDTAEKVNSGDLTIPPMPSDTTYSVEEQKEITLMVARLVVNRAFDLPKENRLNDRFPEVQPIRMREFLDKYWTSKEA